METLVFSFFPLPHRRQQENFHQPKAALIFSIPVRYTSCGAFKATVRKQWNVRRLVHLVASCSRERRSQYRITDIVKLIVIAVRGLDV